MTICCGDRKCHWKAVKKMYILSHIFWNLMSHILTILSASVVCSEAFGRSTGSSWFSCPFGVKNWTRTLCDDFIMIEKENLLWSTSSSRNLPLNVKEKRKQFCRLEQPKPRSEMQSPIFWRMLLKIWGTLFPIFDSGPRISFQLAQKVTEYQKSGEKSQLGRKLEHRNRVT